MAVAAAMQQVEVAAMYPAAAAADTAEMEL